MTDGKNLDFARLLGFGTLGDLIPRSLDFQDEAVGAKLGAKIGTEPTGVQSEAVDAKLDAQS